MSTLRHITVCIVALCACIALRAGDFSAGLFSSPKGFGLSLDYDTGGSILNSYTLYADIYGIPGDKFNDPGTKFVFSHYNLLGRVEKDDVLLSFWLGPGVSLGRVRDSGKGRSFGNAASVNCAASIRLQYSRRICVDLGFNLELGFFGDSNGRDYEITIYNNGIRQSWYPQVKILYEFR